MRVILLTTSFPLGPGETSGIFVARLAEKLATLVEVDVVVPGSVRSPKQETSCPYHVHVVRYAPRRFQRLTHTPGGIPDALRRRDPVLVFLLTLVPALLFRTWRLARHADLVHSNWSIPSIVGAAAARCAGRPAVATLRGEDVTRAQSSRAFRLMLASCVRLNDRIFCVSQAMTDTMRRMFPDHAEKIEFIPNGVATANIQRSSGMRSPIRLVTVGSCIKRKRHHLIIQAIADSRIRGRFELCIVGAGPLLLGLKSLARDLGVADYVKFKGGLPPDKTLELIGDADIFVLASESEGRPNALMEAMATGMPVIASDIDGVRELLGNNCGLTFPDGSLDGLVSCLSKLEQEPELATMLGKQAVHCVRESGLTWENSAALYIAQYHAIS